MPLTIGLAQMRCEKGAIAANLAAIQRTLKASADHGVDILCFPEASITGYNDPTHYPDALLSLDGAEVARFVALTNETSITVLAGLLETNPAGKPYITQIVARAGKLLGFYRKRTIPADEAHLFAPGPTAAPTFPHPTAPFGIAICADIESATVFAESARHGARLIFEAAAPGLYGAQDTRDWRAGYEWWRGECFTKLARYAHMYNVHLAVATQAGRTSDEDFPGGGYVFAPDGTCLAETSDWSEGILYTTLPIS